MKLCNTSCISLYQVIQTAHHRVIRLPFRKEFFQLSDRNRKWLLIQSGFGRPPNVIAVVAKPNEVCSPVIGCSGPSDG